MQNNDTKEMFPLSYYFMSNVFVSFSLVTFIWELSLDNFRLGSFGWDIRLRIRHPSCRLETLDWKLYLRSFRLENSAW